MKSCLKNKLNRGYRRLWTVFLSIFLTAAGHNVAAQNKCATIFSVDGKTTAEALTELGFSQHVAYRIAKDLPSLAKGMTQSYDIKNSAVTLYRGLDRLPNGITLDLNYRTRSSDVWFSMSQSLAANFARSNHFETGTILELQIPSSFFQSSFDPSKSPAELMKLGHTEGTVSRYDILNMKPFVRRIGILTARGSTDKDGIHWITYEEALKIGFFEKGFDYTEYLNAQ